MIADGADDNDLIEEVLERIKETRHPVLNVSGDDGEADFHGHKKTRVGGAPNAGGITPKVM